MRPVRTGRCYYFLATRPYSCHHSDGRFSDQRFGMLLRHAENLASPALFRVTSPKRRDVHGRFLFCFSAPSSCDLRLRTPS